MNPQEIQKQIIEEFSQLQDWEEKYAKVISIGKSLPSILEKYKTDEYLVKGCQSQVWMFAELDENKKMRILADSDAMIVRGLVALLVRVCSGQAPRDLLSEEFNFIKEMGLSDHLSQSRTNGLYSMIKQIKFYALALSFK
jgi:cysteine desulfuration protein SufE